MLKIKNLDVRITNLKGFHSKGYIFKQKDHYSLIVGSSNLTAHALKLNYEWNVKLTSHENGEIISNFFDQFDDVWGQSLVLSSGWIDEYEKVYTENTLKHEMNKIVEFPEDYQANSIKDALEIQPNMMQTSALESIQAVRDAGKTKGLVISATGTGKTFLSAFDVRRVKPKRMLFIVHREQILQKAKSDYLKLLGGVEEDFGILSGNSKQTDRRYLFTTIQTLSKEAVLSSFDPTDFDYILVDEVHRAGANSYQRVINYFTPEVMMGMTATPERTDDFNVYELFDYNIAYEIRLQEALEEDMLCPFHYFGVKEFEIDGKLIDDAVELSKLVTEERVDHILEKVNYYGYSGEKVRGLMFCSRKDEAKKLSLELNKKGLNTVALTGDNTQEERLSRVDQLEDGKLDYILTVDIFNEGIDIPSVNQVVMLRQTQSSIIFIQQLGRGLRKNKTKDYVTVIDFIGNYKNNYLIPVALSGDRSQNKDNIRRKTKDTSYIKGVSTINFEEIAKKQIFNAINDSKLSSLKILRDTYQELKNRIGRVPFLYDYIEQHSLDPEIIVKEHGNYYTFLKKVKEDVPDLSDYEQYVLTMLSQEVLNGKRRHELILMQLLLDNRRVQKEEYIRSLEQNNCQFGKETLASVQRIVELSFFSQSVRKKYGEKPLISVDSEKYMLNEEVVQALLQKPYFRLLVVDLLKTAEEKAKRYNSSRPLTPFQKYSRKDVCKLLNWENDESSTMYGYKPKHGTRPIFVTYHKGEEVESSVNYGDEFLNQEVLKWYTRSNRTLESKEVRKIIDCEKEGRDLHVFVKKDDDEGTEFYYLGMAKPDQESIEQSSMLDKNGKKIPVVTMNLHLNDPIEHHLYHYLTEN